MGRPPKYIIKIGDLYDDYKCIDIITKPDDSQHRKWYIMQCQCCGKIKEMLGSTVGLHKGTKHKSCGKGLGVTFDADFYHRWQSMRQRTKPTFWNHENYYDRGINSDAFASFIDFFNTMYPSWLEHKNIYGAADTSLERIDVNKSYCPENCIWICLNEQKGNMQKTDYFSVTDIQTGEIEYYKNARKYAEAREEIPNKYIYDLIKYSRTYKGKQYKRITKEEFEQAKKNK